MVRSVEKTIQYSPDTISGEALSADIKAVPLFKNNIFKFIEKEGISGKQLYNCNETGLNYKMLPTKTLASKKKPLHQDTRKARNESPSWLAVMQKNRQPQA